MNFHPLANLFPLLPENELENLAYDIGINGLHNEIWLYKGEILDGRNRFLACEKAVVEPRFKEYEGTEAELLPFVLSLNLSRRHLNESQRAMVAAKISNMQQGQKTQDVEISTTGVTPVTQSQSAEMLNVSRESVISAKKVHENATQDVIEAVERGDLAVSAAAKLADKTPEYQARVMQKLGNGDATKVRDAMMQIRREERPNVKPPEGKYRVIYADPPWSYGNDMGSAMEGTTTPTDHYPCMSIEELCELPIKNITEDDAVLFMWVTSPLLEECFPVIKAWGFNYKTSMVWDKMKHNVGHYVSVRHELLLICTKGSCTPDSGKLLPSVVSIERSKIHSQKPQEFRKMIEEMYTHGKKIELFAREESEGWEVYGNEPNIARVA